ncbi:flagellar motor switch protein FliN [Bosea sp. PAMC 26642]|uniref:flagellar motor switch protein FliN n=1 Tax=Bosea sp. (strain PAMC 26642) TaxID=1792307 RepID=UPI0007704FAB|nr:flagellar motor switch protein FliN [Bosea sp. PAMC 26642]AMJ60919.1 flagellar motor switch protein FliN [Bosea sp. PAMC 26642]
MSQNNDLNLPPLNTSDFSFDSNAGSVARSGPVPVKTAEDLEQVFDVPVTVSAVLGSSKIAIGDLLQIVPGAVLELDRRVGEAIDIFVNDRLVARGEVVVVEDRLGVTMTEIIKADRG